MSTTPRRTLNDITIEDDYWYKYLVSTIGYTAEFAKGALAEIRALMTTTSLIHCYQR